MQEERDHPSLVPPVELAKRLGIRWRCRSKSAIGSGAHRRHHLVLATSRGICDIDPLWRRHIILEFGGP